MSLLINKTCYNTVRDSSPCYVTARVFRRLWRHLGDWETRWCHIKQGNLTCLRYALQKPSPNDPRHRASSDINALPPRPAGFLKAQRHLRLCVTSRFPSHLTQRQSRKAGKYSTFNGVRRMNRVWGVAGFSSSRSGGVEPHTEQWHTSGGCSHALVCFSRYLC